MGRFILLAPLYNCSEPHKYIFLWSIYALEILISLLHFFAHACNPVLLLTFQYYTKKKIEKMFEAN